MPIIPNQGFRRDLNLGEGINDTNALNNLGGAGIANDLRVIQNNLRNTDVLTFQFTNTNSVTLNPDTLSTDGYYDDADGFFHFPNNDFVYTNGDRIKFDGIISVPGNGQVVFTPSESYEVINSNGVNKFQLALKGNTTPVTVPANLNYTSVPLIRDNSVSFENTTNFIEPELLSGYRFVDNLNSSFNKVQSNNDFAKFDITRKFSGNSNTLTDDPFKTEGSIVIDDPAQFNQSESQLDSSSSPGVFIGTTRAFSSDNNPWEKVGTALQTEGHFVSVADLVIDGVSNDSTDEVKTINASSSLKRNNIRINGISVGAYAGTGPNVSDRLEGFKFKLPIVVNGETYYMLLKS